MNRRHLTDYLKNFFKIAFTKNRYILEPNNANYNSKRHHVEVIYDPKIFERFPKDETFEGLAARKVL